MGRISVNRNTDFCVHKPLLVAVIDIFVVGPVDVLFLFCSWKGVISTTSRFSGIANYSSCLQVLPFVPIVFR